MQTLVDQRLHRHFHKERPLRRRLHIGRVNPSQCECLCNKLGTGLASAGSHANPEGFELIDVADIVLLDELDNFAERDALAAAEYGIQNVYGLNLGLPSVEFPAQRSGSSSGWTRIPAILEACSTFTSKVKSHVFLAAILRMEATAALSTKPPF